MKTSRSVSILCFTLMLIFEHAALADDSTSDAEVYCSQVAAGAPEEERSVIFSECLQEFGSASEPVVTADDQDTGLPEETGEPEHPAGDGEDITAYCNDFASSATSEEERMQIYKECIDSVSCQENSEEEDACFAEVQGKVDELTEKNPDTEFDFDAMLAQCQAEHGLSQ